MKAIDKIRYKIAEIPEGKPFTASTFRTVATSDNVRQILGRLTKSGEIKRISRGVFVRVKTIPNLGEIPPANIEVAQAIAKSTGETIAVHGAEAARLLQLSTQVPMQLIFYTSGNSRKFTIGSTTVTLKHVSPSKLTEANTPTGLVISALAYLGKENVTLETINRIEKKLSPEDFKIVLQKLESMPLWMSDLFFKYSRG